MLRTETWEPSITQGHTAPPALPQGKSVLFLLPGPHTGCVHSIGSVPWGPSQHPPQLLQCIGSVPEQELWSLKVPTITFHKLEELWQRRDCKTASTAPFTSFLDEYIPSISIFPYVLQLRPAPGGGTHHGGAAQLLQCEHGAANTNPPPPELIWNKGQLLPLGLIYSVHTQPCPRPPTTAQHMAAANAVLSTGCKCVAAVIHLGKRLLCCSKERVAAALPTLQIILPSEQPMQSSCSSTVPTAAPAPCLPFPVGTGPSPAAFLLVNDRSRPAQLPAGAR